MTYGNRYWLTADGGPFSDLLATLDTYCHPEAGLDVYEELIELARDPDPPEHMQVFKRDLRRLLTGGLNEVPEGALWKAAQYSDSSDEAFLRRLWRDLYVDEPFDPNEPRVRRDAKTEIEPYWRDSACGRYDTLLSTLERYRNRYDELRALARSPGQAAWMLVAKGDLQRALRDSSRIPAGALWTAARYPDENDDAFLRRLWRDLYGDEAVDEQEARVERANKREIEAYWRDNPHGRFVTLLDVLDRYRGQYSELLRTVKSPEPPPWTIVLRTDLQRALRDSSQVPNGALWTAARYEEENDEAFLHRLWHDLYGDRPVEDDGSGATP